eukprot:TRINITY_DN3361_c1_g3_i3.p2 TRINITY_DN3361_c1_g3~~TRINITY_DN3361_c1_g3_i3.p2  ORF type:complete len:138 (+),score=8.91 TRINITY_DN3361_c1_g3_i3:364-777(+)
MNEIEIKIPENSPNFQTYIFARENQWSILNILQIQQTFSLQKNRNKKLFQKFLSEYVNIFKLEKTTNNETKLNFLSVNKANILKIPIITFEGARNITAGQEAFRRLNVNSSNNRTIRNKKQKIIKQITQINIDAFGT